MENLGQETPILVRRGKKARHEDHGGAWKVAMADFALALMALFLVLWIINNSNEDQREAIAGYFQDPKAFTEGQLAPSSSAINLGGTPAAVNSALMPRDN
ncbi:MAG: flagellar motor protein MotB, partial [Oceanobacter sp.]